MTLAIDRPTTFGGSLLNRAHPRTVVDEHVAHGFAQPNLVVSIVEDDGRFFATTDVLPMYGEGESLNSAVHDLLASMSHLRRELEGGRSHLSPELAEQLHRLEALNIPSL